MTHYIPPFTRQNGRKQEAVCGAWVRPDREFSREPDCPHCATWLEQDIQDTRTSDEVFGEEQTDVRHP